MKEQIKQGKFAIADLSFYIYSDYRGILSLWQVAKPNKRISGLLPLPEDPNTYRADLYFKDKSIRAIRFTLSFRDRLSGEIDVTELIEAIQQYSKYPDNKKAYLQGVVIPQNLAIPEQPTDNTPECKEPRETRTETRSKSFEDDIEVPQKVLQVLNEFQELNPDEKELFTYFQYNLQEIRNYQEKTTFSNTSKSNENTEGDI